MRGVPNSQNPGAFARGSFAALDSTVMLRPALLEDIAAMHALRLGVRENRLRDLSRATPADYERRLAQLGRAG